VVTVKNFMAGDGSGKKHGPRAIAGFSLQFKWGEARMSTVNSENTPAGIFMLKLKTIAGVVAMVLCKSAWAGDTYMLHENLHIGQQVTYVTTQDAKDHSDMTTDGKETISDTETVQSWKATETMVGVASGSATQARMDIAPESFDTVKTTGQDEKKTPCPFIGKAILVNREPDGSVSDDYPRKPEDAGNDLLNSDIELLDNFLTPDEEAYADIPVAVGDTWDNSAKMAKGMGLGPSDHVSATTKLDWVKTINGKQIAEISTTVVTTTHVDAGPNGRMATDTVDTQTGVMLVDIEAGMIVKGDCKDVTKTKSPPSSPVKLVEEIDTEFHSEVIPDPAAGAATQP
jgi:hypothetical protein